MGGATGLKQGCVNRGTTENFFSFKLLLLMLLGWSDSGSQGVKHFADKNVKLKTILYWFTFLQYLCIMILASVAGQCTDSMFVLL